MQGAWDFPKGRRYTACRGLGGYFVKARRDGEYRPDPSPVECPCPAAGCEHRSAIDCGSLCDPAPNRLVIDKMIASAEDKEIDPVLVISKTDLADAGELESVYRLAGIRTVRFSAVSGEGADELRELLMGRVSAFREFRSREVFLLNRLYPDFSLATGEISRKLGRGEAHDSGSGALPLPAGGYVVDTPGFSSLDVEQIARIRKENLPFVSENFCRIWASAAFLRARIFVRRDVRSWQGAEGKIHPSRHESYRLMYEELKNMEERQYK